MEKYKSVAIIGAGNIGLAIAKGLRDAGIFKPAKIILTRRKVQLLRSWQQEGYQIRKDNSEAVQAADIIILAVEPKQADAVIDEIKTVLMPEKHLLISVVSGLSTSQLLRRMGKKIPVIRAMPNTAIAIRESITCLASDVAKPKQFKIAQSIFDAVGMTLKIEEEQMSAATALGACGIAFFLRVIRAASQGGIEVGFHSGDALKIAAQTAKGAAALLLAAGQHPEYEIDRVTTPRGCTISGLNQMEHEGLSSAMIKGIVTSANLAAVLYSKED